jgi:hypothetical protein
MTRRLRLLCSFGFRCAPRQKGKNMKLEEVSLKTKDLKTKEAVDYLSLHESEFAVS